MGILDKIKSPFRTSEQKLAKPPKQAEAVRQEKKEKSEKAVATPTGTSALGSIILKAPHISERATFGSQHGKYTFRVTGKATKINIKRAVEELYRVKVDKINVLWQHGKIRHRGRIKGKTPNYKKAVVTVVKGQKIDIATQ